jgi:hypothetical protein
MKYTLTVQSEDYAFIKEAIKLRALILTEALEKQVILQVAQEIRADPSLFESAPVKAEGGPFSFIGEPKKPHWTQTAKGKKIMATRKRKGQK